MKKSCRNWSVECCGRKLSVNRFTKEIYRIYLRFNPRSNICSFLNIKKIFPRPQMWEYKPLKHLDFLGNHHLLVCIICLLLSSGMYCIFLHLSAVLAYPPTPAKFLIHPPGLQYKILRLWQDGLYLCQRAHQQHLDPLPLAHQCPSWPWWRHQSHEGGGLWHILYILQDDHIGFSLLPSRLQGPVCC